MARVTTGGEAGSGEAVIGRSTRVRGRVAGDGDLRVEGSVEGDISLRGTLTVLDGGRAVSNVEASAVTIGGELEGDVRADGLVRIEAGARVRGDVYGEAVAIDDGADFSGHLNLEFELPPELGAGSTGRRR